MFSAFRRPSVLRSVAVTTLAVALLVGCAQVAPTPGDRPAVGTTAASAAGSRTPTSTPTPTPTPEPAVLLTPSVPEGATVPVDTVVSVGAAQGTVSTVEMTYTDPKLGKQTVQGTLAADGTSWTANSLLEPGVTYSLAMSGQSVAGVASTTDSTFTSQALSLKQQVFPTIVTGGTVGVGMPVVVRFDVPVTDKASFEKHMAVTALPAQEGSWHWYSSTEAHWRPAVYWQPGSKVSVNVDINSVPGGKGVYGQKSVQASFTVGRSLIMNADLATHQMTVVKDGAVVKTIPITGGKAGFETRSGVKVISEKFDTLKMDANTVGIEPGSPDYYNIPDVRYAMRETNSGEFIHAAPWSVASQGKTNVSHGCIGISTANGAWLFGEVLIGDPVVVTGTSRKLEPGNGITDWNASFAEYAKGSALA